MLISNFYKAYNNFKMIINRKINTIKQKNLELISGLELRGHIYI